MVFGLVRRRLEGHVIAREIARSGDHEDGFVFFIERVVLFQLLHRHRRRGVLHGDVQQDGVGLLARRGLHGQGHLLGGAVLLLALGFDGEQAVRVGGLELVAACDLRGEDLVLIARRQRHAHAVGLPGVHGDGVARKARGVIPHVYGHRALQAKALHLGGDGGRAVGLGRHGHLGRAVLVDLCRCDLLVVRAQLDLLGGQGDRTVAILRELREQDVSQFKGQGLAGDHAGVQIQSAARDIFRILGLVAVLVQPQDVRLAGRNKGFQLLAGHQHQSGQLRLHEGGIGFLGGEQVVRVRYQRLLGLGQGVVGFAGRGDRRAALRRDLADGGDQRLHPGGNGIVLFHRRFIHQQGAVDLADGEQALVPDLLAHRVEAQHHGLFKDAVHVLGVRRVGHRLHGDREQAAFADLDHRLGRGGFLRAAHEDLAEGVAAHGQQQVGPEGIAVRAAQGVQGRGVDLEHLHVVRDRQRLRVLVVARHQRVFGEVDLQLPRIERARQAVLAGLVFLQIALGDRHHGDVGLAFRHRDTELVFPVVVQIAFDPVGAVIAVGHGLFKGALEEITVAGAVQRHHQRGLPVHRLQVRAHGLEHAGGVGDLQVDRPVDVHHADRRDDRAVGFHLRRRVNRPVIHRVPDGAGRGNDVDAASGEAQLHRAVRADGLALDRGELAILPRAHRKAFRRDGRAEVISRQRQREGLARVDAERSRGKGRMDVGIVGQVRQHRRGQLVARRHGVHANAHGNGHVVDVEHVAAAVRDVPQFGDAQAPLRNGGLIPVGAVGLVRGDQRLVNAQLAVDVKVLHRYGRARQRQHARVADRHEDFGVLRRLLHFDHAQRRDDRGVDFHRHR